MLSKDLKLHSDEFLLELVRSNQDHTAFSIIYDRYWSWLLGMAYNLTRDKSTSKEIVQELFIALWNRRENIKIENLKSYLATSIKFSVFKQIERERRRRNLAAEKFGAKEEALLDQKIESLFAKEYFANLLENLPEKCRLVLNYSRLQDFSNAQIAEKMNISEKTVEGHLTKGLKLIRTNFKETGFLTSFPIYLIFHYIR